MKEEIASKELLRGFNHGYLIQQLTPTLADKLVMIFEKRLDDYAFGFRDGAKQWQKEAEKEKPKRRHYTLSKSNVNKLKDRKDRSKDQDKDRII